jgi:hypothetical protein
MKHLSAKRIAFYCLCFCVFPLHAADRPRAKSKPPTLEKQIEVLKEELAKVRLEQERQQRQLQEVALRRTSPRAEMQRDQYSYP